MKLNQILLQLLAMATAGSTIPLPKGTPILSCQSPRGGLLTTNLAESKTGHLHNERNFPANAEETFVYPSEADGTDVWQRSATDAEMDADDAVVYPDGRGSVPAWSANPPTLKRS